MRPVRFMTRSFHSNYKLHCILWWPFVSIWRRTQTFYLSWWRQRTSMKHLIKFFSLISCVSLEKSTVLAENIDFTPNYYIYCGFLFTLVNIIFVTWKLVCVHVFFHAEFKYDIRISLITHTFCVRIFKIQFFRIIFTLTLPVCLKYGWCTLLHFKNSVGMKT
jgi:hypothetical protein